MIGALHEYSARECERIARHNDYLRKHGVGGIIFLDDHLLQRPLYYQARVLEAIRDDNHLDQGDRFRQAGSVGVGNTEYAWNISSVRLDNLSLQGVDPLDYKASMREMNVFVSDPREATTHYCQKYRKTIQIQGI